jgi:predicted nucleotidyltransferase
MIDPGTKLAEVPKKQVAALCRRYGIRKLAFFGSVLREDFGPGSDLDLLVEFDPGVRVGLIRLAEIEAKLGRLFGRDVDLRTPAELSRYFRDRVMAEAKTWYERR